MRLFEKLKDYFIAIIVVVFALVLFWFTRDHIFDSTDLSDIDLTDQSMTVLKATFSTINMVMMLRVTFFYFIPILFFTMFLYLLFFKVTKFSFSFGKYKFEIEQDIESRVTQIVKQAKGKSKNNFEQIVYQVEKINQFNYHCLKKQLNCFPIFFEEFLRCFRDVFICKSPDLRCGMYFMGVDQVYCYNYNGMSSIDTPKIQQLIADIVENKKHDCIFDLEKKYVTRKTTFEKNIVHSVIVSPLICNNGKVLGVATVYSRDEKTVFHPIDADILYLFCQLFNIGFAGSTIPSLCLEFK